MGSESAGMKRCTILCVGNELHGDDGFGPAIYTALQSGRLPSDVHLQRADLGSPSTLGHLERSARLIVVDALRGFGPPGSVHVQDAWPLADICLADAAPAGLHAAGLGQLLGTWAHLDARRPPVTLIGVEIPPPRPYHPGLSPAIAARLPLVLEHIQALLS